MIRGLFSITIGRAYVSVYISASMMNFETIFQFFVISNDYLDETISELIQRPKAHVKLELPTISGHSCSLRFTMNTMPVPNASHVTVLCNNNHGPVMISLSSSSSFVGFFLFLFLFSGDDKLEMGSTYSIHYPVMKSIKHPRVPSTSARGSTF